MSISALHPSLLAHPLAQALGPGAEGLLNNGVELLEFKPGQPLCEGHLLPSQVLVIHEGSARLLGRDQGRLTTLQRLGPGDVVGLASLLRASACEAVTASTTVQATALSDQLILELYANHEGFRTYCANHLWPAELQSLLNLLQERLSSGNPSLQPALEAGLREARLVPPTPSAVAQAQGSNATVLIASANTNLDIGDVIAAGEPLPQARAPFALRLISLPAAVLQLLQTSSDQPNATAASNTGTPTSALQVRPAPSQPVGTSRDLGQRSKAVQLISGQGPLEETLACFQMLARQLDLPFRRDAVEKVVRDAMRRGQRPNLNLCGQLATMLGLHAMGAKVPAEMGNRLQVPALVPWQGGVALAVESNAAGLKLASPSEGWLQLNVEQLKAAFPEGIDLVLVERTTATPEQKFGLSWFLPVLQRYRGILLQVLLASFVVQLFTLANPLLIQVIIDKVISQRSLDTLQVLGLALVVVTLLEGVLGSLRTFLFTETTNRIDTRLGAEVIDHLLRLPLGYFDRRPVGELGSRVAELEKIRNFLTGQALTTVLDALFSVIYILVMALYSWVLTIVALIVVPIQVGLTVLGAPLFRRQFRQAAQENARTQSHLVEVLTGIQTVKAQNVEMVSRWKWQELYQAYIARTFEKTITGTALNETSQVLQKISQLLVLWVGATMVLKGELTLGQLIAFRIISGYVTQPLLRLSTIWQNVQELKVSFERLADVVDTPQESNDADQKKIPLPPIKGHVTYENLSFSFLPGSPQVLNNVSLDIPAGTFVGVVGQSGSGKSTLMKLLPRLYSPNAGRVLIDGYDIDKVELYSLRRQIGIVPQDPLLFAGTVSDNIALTDPDASSNGIVEAARVACAHDFIMELPAGYSSDVGERGAGLSGGQRQRLAIARTLLNRPQLMVLDEATSALDYDTERRVCENLKKSLAGCTVFFITHRLSTIRNADLIVMMDKGAVVEQGTHAELMDLRGRYFALYRQQEAA
jgi:subfamily B ATP-binding cassette protein HlyB/CyaB